LRAGDWKLIAAYAAGGQEVKVELFNIADDPEEQNDLAGSKPGKVAEMRRSLEAAMAADRDSVAEGDRGL
jgi:hypothetical protein